MMFTVRVMEEFQWSCHFKNVVQYSDSKDSVSCGDSDMDSIRKPAPTVIRGEWVNSDKGNVFGDESGDDSIARINVEFQKKTLGHSKAVMDDGGIQGTFSRKSSVIEEYSLCLS